MLARSLLGLAQSALFPVAAGTIRAWFPVGRWASALAQRHGWRSALVITSVPSLLLVALWYASARDRPAPASPPGG